MNFTSNNYFFSRDVTKTNTKITFFFTRREYVTSICMNVDHDINTKKIINIILMKMPMKKKTLPFNYLNDCIYTLYNKSIHVKEQ